MAPVAHVQASFTKQGMNEDRSVEHSLLPDSEDLKKHVTTYAYTSLGPQTQRNLVPNFAKIVVQSSYHGGIQKPSQTFNIQTRSLVP